MNEITPELREKIALYSKHLHEIIHTDISDEMLNAVNIKSVSMINEVMTEYPAEPLLIVKKLDGTEERIWGFVKIPEYLNNLIDQIENSGYVKI
jgi:hypothetical protein